jgi:ribosomal-protein-alanine N-acetyltransferase
MELRLLPLSPADREPFLQATRRSRALHRPWVHPPTTRAAFDAFAGDLGETRQRLLLWGRVPGPVPDVLLGYFSLGEIVRGALNSAYLGYWGVVPHAGQGLMTEGMKLLLAHAFRQARLHRVEANIQPDNRASIALASRSGFRKEGFSPRYLKIAGRWRDHERWALTVEDWRERGAFARR